jgi:hypothetical protein
LAGIPPGSALVGENEGQQGARLSYKRDTLTQGELSVHLRLACYNLVLSSLLHVYELGRGAPSLFSAWKGLGLPVWRLRKGAFSLVLCMCGQRASVTFLKVCLELRTRLLHIGGVER